MGQIRLRTIWVVAIWALVAVGCGSDTTEIGTADASVPSTTVSEAPLDVVVPVASRSVALGDRSVAGEAISAFAADIFLTRLVRARRGRI